MLIIFLDLYLKKANTRVMVLSLAYAILASSYEFSNMMQPYLLVYMQAAEMKKRAVIKIETGNPEDNSYVSHAPCVSLEPLYNNLP